MLQTDLTSLELSYRENVMEQMFGGCFDFPCECGTSLWSWTQGTLPMKNDLQVSASKECVTQHAEC